MNKDPPFNIHETTIKYNKFILVEGSYEFTLIKVYRLDILLLIKKIFTH